MEKIVNDYIRLLTVLNRIDTLTYEDYWFMCKKLHNRVKDICKDVVVPDINNSMKYIRNG